MGKSRKARAASKFEEHSSGPVEEVPFVPRLPLPQQPSVPDWMSDLVDQARPTAESNKVAGKGVKGDHVRFKALTIMASQVGHLIGPNGAGITAIRKASGADVKIDHGRGKAYGTVTITGNVDLAERLIYERLATCPQTNA